MSARLTANEQNNLCCQLEQDILPTYSCKQYLNALLLTFFPRILKFTDSSCWLHIQAFLFVFTMCTKISQNFRRVGGVHVK